MMKLMAVLFVGLFAITPAFASVDNGIIGYLADESWEYPPVSNGEPELSAAVDGSIIGYLADETWVYPSEQNSEMEPSVG